MDPLDFFHGVKVAADERVPGRPAIKNRQSTDAGERAIAGIAAVSSLSSKAVPWIADAALQHIGELDDVPWPGEPMTGLKRLGALAGETKQPKTKLMGLIPVSARPTRVSPYKQDAIDAIRMLGDIIPTVDDFIDKHKLPEKGVRLSLYRGPLSGQPGYRFLEKRVHLPQLSQHSVLHELGHAVDASTPVGKARYFGGPIVRNAMMAAIPLAFVAGDEIKRMIPGTVDDKAISFLQENAPSLTAATLAATDLYPEFKASAIALKHIKNTQGIEAAKAAAKRLGPLFLSSFTSFVPAVIGMALAKKYMREEGAEEKGISERQRQALSELEKAGADEMHPIMRQFQSWYDDVAHVGEEIADGSKKLVTEPGRLRRIAGAAKTIGTSPQFIHGALATAVPATLGALYLYSTRSGKTIRERTPEGKRPGYMTHLHPERLVASKVNESWRERNPLKFAGLVGLGAALSGGVLSKFFSDLHKVL